MPRLLVKRQRLSLGISRTLLLRSRFCLRGMLLLALRGFIFFASQEADLRNALEHGSFPLYFPDEAPKHPF